MKLIMVRFWATARTDDGMIRKVSKRYILSVFIAVIDADEVGLKEAGREEIRSIVFAIYLKINPSLSEVRRDGHCLIKVLNEITAAARILSWYDKSGSSVESFVFVFVPIARSQRSRIFSRFIFTQYSFSDRTDEISIQQASLLLIITYGSVAVDEPDEYNNVAVSSVAEHNV
jgi:hypothetical protein